MECPRCGEDNLPGLERCLGCGQSLAEDPADLLIPTRPQVRDANPLARRVRRRRRPRFIVSEPKLLLLRRMLSACLLGLLPGLGPGLRRDGRTALVLVGAWLGCGVLWLLLWRSAVQPLAVVGALSVMASGALVEVRARLPQRGVATSLAATGFSVALALGVYAVGSTLVRHQLPRLRVTGGAALEPGHFLLEQVRPGELVRDDLVAVGQLPRLWQWAGEPVQVGPVLALPGERVESDAQGLRVDGEPPAVHPLNPDVAPPRLPEGGVVVPEGQVAVLVAPIRVLPVEDLAGRLYYRWLPQADRGPLDWPPDDPEAP